MALLSKWKGRSLVDGDAIWRGLLLHRYGDFSSAFTHGSVEAINKGSRGSLWWRDLLILDLYLPPLSVVFSHIFAGCIAKNASVVDSGSWTNSIWRWQEPWTHLDDPFYREEADNLHQILQKIKPDPGK